MAVMPQAQDVPPGWTVEQVVAHGRAPHLGAWRGAGRDDKEAVAAALHSTSIEEFAHRPVETLSGGERQRVLLARALAQTPRLLLLDEPTAFLDLQYQWEMLELVERARRERGLSVVSVLHDLNLAAAFATQVALLQSGKVVSLGSPADVLTEERIAGVYGRRVTVGRHPATGRPTVMPWASSHPAAPAARAHVISGGGSGAALLRHLASDGHAVTAGVLNVGDSDWETARALGLEVAEEAPFSPISDTAAARAAHLIACADTVIVAPMPVGPGNLANVRLAAEAARQGGRVVMVGPMTAELDFTGGEAMSVWSAAIEAGAIVEPDVARAVLRLHRADNAE